jgi:methylmalonyl-CoA mutase
LDPTLFSEFPAVTNEEWKNTILKDLKDQAFEKLQWHTEDGLLIAPYYRKEDLPSQLPDISKRESGWKITEPIFESRSIALANEIAKKALGSGADALLFYSHEEGGKTYGVPLPSSMDLKALLFGIDLSQTPIILSLANRTPDFASDIRILATSAKQILADYDPFGTALLCGELGAKDEKVKSNLANLSSQSSNAKFICVHAYYLRNSGATISQELVYSLSWGVEYLNLLIDAGLSAELAAESIWFWMGIGTDYFTEIAKFRAFRILWSQALNAYSPGLGDKTQALIQASTSEWNFTAYDPHTNILRGTTAAMSAAIGGADFVHVNPFDQVYNDANEFGQRIARNSQLLLRHESHLDKVEDPASGSYYLEELTHLLAESAWKEFQAIESEGGFHKALSSGKIQDKVDASAKLKRDSVATKKQTLLGTNQYPQTKERHPELKATLENTKSLLDFPNNGKYKRLNPLRLSYDFDRLRNLTDVHVEAGKSLPKVFLLTIGDLVMRKARAGFSTNFIGCLGYEIIDNAGFENIAQGISAAKQARADIVVLCSSDEEYSTFIGQFADAIKVEMPKVWPIVAGYPKELITMAEEKGIHDFIHLKRNLIEFMEKAQARL